jgi:hypothetical protein
VTFEAAGSGTLSLSDQQAAIYTHLNVFCGLLGLLKIARAFSISFHVPALTRGIYSFKQRKTVTLVLRS